MNILDGLDGHLIWETAFTIVGGGLMWFAKEAKGVIDGKADKKQLEDHIDDTSDKLRALDEKMDSLREDSNERHAQNTDRLDRIYDKLSDR